MTTNTDQAVADLPEALGFTETELAANRAGHLTDTQKERLSKMWRRTLNILIAVVIGVGLIATIFLYLAQENNSLILYVIGIGLTVLNAVIMGIGASSYLRVSRDIRNGRAAVLEGTLRHTIRLSGRTRTYILDIGSERIVVPRATFNAFEEGIGYRLYRAPATRMLLTAEKT